MKRIRVGDPLNMEIGEQRGSGEDEEAACPCLILKKSKEDLRRAPASAILLNKPHITIGRTFDVDYCILSQAISRLHCEIKSCSDRTDEWKLVDKSGNGVFINGDKIQRNVGYNLREGDVIDLASADDPIVSYVFKGMSKHEGSTDVNSKRLKPEFQLSELTQSTSVAGKDVVAPTQTPEASVTPERLELRRKNDDLALELQNMKDKMKQQEAALRQQWESEQEEKREAEEARAEALMRDKAEEEKKCQQKLTELKAKHATALEEKNQLTDRLNSMCEGRSKEAEIEKEKAHLEEELRKKDGECSTMRQRLDELTSRNEECAALVIKMRDDLIKNVNETMETELQCSICSELFVKAATLNCSHSYCSYCINEWRKKKPECPICRQNIVTVTPSLVLDNFIEKLVDTLDTSMKEMRKELLEERSKLPVQNAARNAEIAVPGVAENRHIQPRRRQRGDARVRRGGRARIQTLDQYHAVRDRGAPQRGPAPPRGGMMLIPITVENRPPVRPLLEAPVHPSINVPTRPRYQVPHGFPIIEVLSESQSDDDDDVGVGSGYYGGHGLCYRCGRRGHWSNQCPF